MDIVGQLEVEGRGSAGEPLSAAAGVARLGSAVWSVKASVLGAEGPETELAPFFELLALALDLTTPASAIRWRCPCCFPGMALPFGV